MNSGTAQTILSKDAVFEGKIISKDSVRIDGRLVGEVRSEATIELGETGSVEGNVTAAHVITAGHIKGAINAREKVELKGKSRLEGDLITTRLVIEDGAQFEGMCKMGGRPSDGAASVSTPAAAAEGGEPERRGLFGSKPAGH
ncbi:MAG: polymer-forming cytoskeletal protein [Candidatus Delongbacteria bacterium]